MDRVEKLVHELSVIYQEVSETFSNFQKDNGLNCLAGCGACCKSPEVEATVLEMLPMAYEMYLQNDFSALEITQTDHLPCNQYRKTSEDGDLGFCSKYSTRPGICRMFGAGQYRSKDGETKILMCKKIKEVHPEFKNNTMADDKFMYTTWRGLINSVEPSMSNKLYPINFALKNAMEYIANYYWFNPPTFVETSEGRSILGLKIKVS